jgi:hypothetical protein
MFDWPISSPKMTRMLGFRTCCAAAGIVVATTTAATTLRQITLIALMVRPFKRLDLHDVLVQPNVHFCRASELAPIAKLLRELLTRAQTAVELEQLHFPR